MAGKIALIISNFAALPAIYLTLFNRSLGISALIFSSMIWSILYHSCDTQLVNCQQQTYISFQYMDFVSSIALVSLMTLYISFHNVDRDSSAGRFIFNFMLMLEIYLNYTQVISAQYIVMIVGGPALLLLIAQTIYLKCQNNSWPSLSILDGFLGASLVVLALIFQFVLAPLVNYPIFHSLWHLTIYLSVFFIYNMQLVNKIVHCCERSRRHRRGSSLNIEMREIIEGISDQIVEEENPIFLIDN